MNVVGVTEDGSTVFVDELGHGEDPSALAFELGYVVTEPSQAVRNVDGLLELSFRVRPAAGQQRPGHLDRADEAGLQLSPPVAVEVRQRVAAYALVTSELGLLATEFSDRTGVPGLWGLPGGGIEEHEQPRDAVLREVREETQQMVALAELVHVQTSHWIGRSPRGTIEDFHAVRLVYAGTCAAPTTPVVADVGGTTESARWVPLEQWQEVAWTIGWRQVLAERLPVR